jgi:hypothetical protein
VQFSCAVKSALEAEQVCCHWIGPGLVRPETSEEVSSLRRQTRMGYVPFGHQSSERHLANNFQTTGIISSRNFRGPPKHSGMILEQCLKHYAGRFFLADADGLSMN